MLRKLCWQRFSILMRYSIKTLLAAMTIVGVILGIVLYATKDLRERLAMQADIREATGADWVTVNEQKVISLVFTRPIALKELGRCKAIGTIELRGQAASNASLRTLSQFESIDVILFQSSSISDPEDMQHLASIHHLRALLIWNTSVDDSAIVWIAKIPGLEIVDFHNTNITQAGKERLRVTRPEIKITDRL
jgi:hypothetical protein